MLESKKQRAHERVTGLKSETFGEKLNGVKGQKQLVRSERWERYDLQ